MSIPSSFLNKYRFEVNSFEEVRLLFILLANGSISQRKHPCFSEQQLALGIALPVNTKPALNASNCELARRAGTGSTVVKFMTS
eukprot:5584474-Amphidinium_carterae.1